MDIRLMPAQISLAPGARFSPLTFGGLQKKRKVQTEAQEASELFDAIKKHHPRLSGDEEKRLTRQLVTSYNELAKLFIDSVTASAPAGPDQEQIRQDGRLLSEKITEITQTVHADRLRSASLVRERLTQVQALAAETLNKKQSQFVRDTLSRLSVNGDGLVKALGKEEKKQLQVMMGGLVRAHKDSENMPLKTALEDAQETLRTFIGLDSIGRTGVVSFINMESMKLLSRINPVQGRRLWGESYQEGSEDGDKDTPKEKGKRSRTPRGIYKLAQILTEELETLNKARREKRLAVLRSDSPVDMNIYASQEPLLAVIPEENRVTAMKLAKDLVSAKKRIAEGNLKLVAKQARKNMGRGLSFVDLIGEGNVGLITATEKFDYNPGHKLSTYATWWINQSIKRALQYRFSVHRPAYVVEANGYWKNQESTYFGHYGKTPSAMQLAFYTLHNTTPEDKILSQLEAFQGNLADLGNFPRSGKAITELLLVLKLQETEARLQKKLHRMPTVDELAGDKTLGLKATKIKHIRSSDAYLEDPNPTLVRIINAQADYQSRFKSKPSNEELAYFMTFRRQPTEAKLEPLMAIIQNFNAIENYRSSNRAETHFSAMGRTEQETDEPQSAENLLEEADGESPEDKVTFEDLKEAIKTHLLRWLNERPREIIMDRFGIDKGDPMTLEDIAQKYKLTRERIRQMEQKAILKLKTVLAYKPQIARAFEAFVQTHQ